MPRFPETTLLLAALLAGCGGEMDAFEYAEGGGETTAQVEGALSCGSSQAIVSVTASGADAPTPAKNAIDSDLATRWSNLGVGSYITADLGAVKQLCGISVGWYNGAARTNDFVLSVSSDGATFTSVFAGKSSGTTNQLEAYAIPVSSARYVRLTVNGNSVNSWASVTELSVTGLPAGAWYSKLYPPSWQPPESATAQKDAAGRFLADFSFAGYRKGEVRPPYGTVPVVATVSASYGNGSTDATSAIQGAINSACSKGGGAVLLPSGTFRVKLPSTSAPAALTINCRGVVLRGSGRDATRIYFDDAARARGKAVLRIGGSGSVLDAATTPKFMVKTDLLKPTRTIPVTTSGLAVGAIVALRQPVTAAYRAEHRMDSAHTGEPDFWVEGNGNGGIIYLRRVVAVTSSTVTLDEPTRLPMKLRDAPRLYARSTYISESGVEELAIGMRESTAPGGRDADEDYNIANRMGWQVHASSAIHVDAAMDVWIRRVDTYKPAANALAHVLSHGITFSRGSARVTVDDCRFGPPQYRGGGGNGYGLQINGQDILLADVYAEGSRHNFTFNDSAASGNVLLRMQSVNSRMSDDSHRFLAHQNLYDQPKLTSAWLQAVNRGNTSAGAGFTATQFVYWRTQANSLHVTARGCAIETAQFDHGYVIGTAGVGTVCTKSTTNGYWNGLDQGLPVDWVEGAGQGAGLYPGSLYLDQRLKRCEREGLSCTLNWL